METPNRFLTSRLTRRTALVGLAPMLAGCANRAATVSYDRSSGTRLHQVAVLLPGFPHTPSVGVNGRLSSSFFSVPLAVVGATMDSCQAAPVIFISVYTSPATPLTVRFTHNGMIRVTASPIPRVP